MKVTIYEHAAELPLLVKGTYFHSPELMELCEHTPRHKPFMAVASDENGDVRGSLLAIMRYRGSWLPPYLYTQVRIFGDNGCSQEDFALLMEAITERLSNRTLYLEVSNLREKMFGYGGLRHQGFFPVRWMNIHNSLHSRTPEERIGQRLLHRIENSQKRGVTTKLVETEQEFRDCYRLLRKHHWLKPRRYLPAEPFFKGMMDTGRCKMLITTYHEHVVGTSVLVFSGTDAYLWYSASLRKSFAPLHPHAVTIWETIKYAHGTGKDHIRFMDVGLPFRKNPFRDFILRYGGKETTTYRWFRINIRWINGLASWLWRE